MCHLYVDALATSLAGQQQEPRHQSPAPVGEDDGSAADTEEAVWDEHGPLVAEVPVLGDVLGADDQRPAAWIHLQPNKQINK